MPRPLASTPSAPARSRRRRGLLLALPAAYASAMAMAACSLMVDVDALGAGEDAGSSGGLSTSSSSGQASSSGGAGSSSGESSSGSSSSSSGSSSSSSGSSSSSSGSSSSSSGGVLAFCAGQPDARFCEDFDGPGELGDRWHARAGAAAQSLSDDAFSPPNALLCDLRGGGGDATTLTRSLTVRPNGLRVDARVKLGPFAAGFSEVHVLRVALPPFDYSHYVDLAATATGLRIVYNANDATIDPGETESHPLSAAPLQSWRHLRLHLAPDGTSQRWLVWVDVDGSPGSPVRLRAGPTSLSGASVQLLAGMMDIEGTGEPPLTWLDDVLVVEEP